MMESTVPPPGAKTPGFSIDLPHSSRQAVVRTVAGLAAAGLGAFGAFQAVQNRTQPTRVAAISPATRVSSLSAAEKSARIRRDIFFSNFAEARMDDFGVAGVVPAEKVRFAVEHARINSPEQIQAEPATGKRYVSAQWLAKTSEKYLGDGYEATQPYFLPAVPKPVQAVRFARVESWKPLPGVKNDRFAATVRVYDPPVDWKADPYSWTMSSEPTPKEPRLVGRWRATVRRIPGGYDPPFRYILTSWERY